MVQWHKGNFLEVSDLGVKDCFVALLLAMTLNLKNSV